MDIPRPIKPPPITLLDGAIDTNLTACGMNGCAAQWILENEDCLINLQCDYINAGSHIIYAPTFCASAKELSSFGYNFDEIFDMNKKLVSLSKKAREKAREKSNKNDVLIAGVMVQTGEFLSPFGDLTFDEMSDIYDTQVQALSDADLILIEGMVSISEARVAVLACRKYNKPIYVTITINSHGKMSTGASALTALITLQELGISAFGISGSCCVDLMAEEIAKLSPFANIPLIANPNAGQPNPLLPNIYELSPFAMQDAMKKILDAGATIIGGGCGTTPKHIEAIADMLTTYQRPEIDDSHTQQENDFLLSNETDIFAIDNDRMDFSEPVYCSLDMADDLLEACNDSIDILLIVIYSIDDAKQFAQNAHFAKLPVCFASDNLSALETALKLYNGRAMVYYGDAVARSVIQEDELKKLADKYGALID